VGGAPGDEVLDRDVLLAVIYLGKVGADAQEQQVRHGKLMVHAESDQIPCGLRLQIIILHLHEKILQLDVRRP
jgi:hypothetical protein